MQYCNLSARSQKRLPGILLIATIDRTAPSAWSYKYGILHGLSKNLSHEVPSQLQRLKLPGQMHGLTAFCCAARTPCDWFHSEAPEQLQPPGRHAFAHQCQGRSTQRKVHPAHSHAKIHMACITCSASPPVPPLSSQALQHSCLSGGQYMGFHTVHPSVC